MQTPGRQTGNTSFNDEVISKTGRPQTSGNRQQKGKDKATRKHKTFKKPNQVQTESNLWNTEVKKWKQLNQELKP